MASYGGSVALLFLDTEMTPLGYPTLQDLLHLHDMIQVYTVHNKLLYIINY